MQAICHPNKESVGRGVCGACYQRAWRRTPEGLASEKAAGLKWRIANRDWRLNYDLVRGFNITLERYNEMLVAQNGVCKICKAPPSEDRRLVVDHDHKCCPIEPNWNNKKLKRRRVSCGECIRGLLCDECNQGLGKFKDEVARLKSAVEYLERV